MYRANAFGNPCKSLGQVIEDLQRIAAEFPHMVNEPVWVACDAERLIRPVLYIGLRRAEAGDNRTTLKTLGG